MKKRIWLFPLVLFAAALFLNLTGCTSTQKVNEDKANDIVSHLVKTLDLNDVQRRQLDNLKNDILNKRVEINRQMADQIQYQLDSQLHREKFDQAQFDDFMKKYNENEAKFIDFVGQKFGEFHAMLSPAQREKLVQDIDKNKSLYFGK